MPTWYWADDSKGGHQDLWREYNATMSAKLEKSYNSTKKDVEVDAKRYVDVKNMLQRLYANPEKRRKVKREPDSDSSDDETPAPARVKKKPAATPAPKAKWFWAGDSKKGSQDVWVEFNPTMTAKLEKAYVDGDDEVRVDKERYVDLRNKKTMLQRRYDDPTLRRTVKRESASSGGDGSSSDSDTGTAKAKPVPARPDPKRKASRGSDTEEASEDDSDTEVHWFWANDSAGGGHQDQWVEYSADWAKKLEAARKAGENEMRVDTERFVDIKNMLQRRYDDRMKRRKVKRTVTKKRAAATPSVKRSKSTVGATASSSASVVVSPPAPVPTTGHLSLPKVSEFWTGFDGMDYYEVNCPSTGPEYKWADSMLTGTFAAMHANNSANHKIIFSKFQMTRLVRLQNPACWLRYNIRRERIAAAKPPKATQIITRDNIALPGPKLEHAVNEVYLYHGLNNKLHLDEIAQYGFDPRHCALEGMFGAGLYFAENSSKSSQYVHSGTCTLVGAGAIKNRAACSCKQTDECCMLLCRVTLGEPLIEEKFRGNAPGQFWHGRRREPTKNDGTPYHSVIGESVQNKPFAGCSLQLREYIIYESSQVYPEYKVYYKRVK